MTTEAIGTIALIVIMIYGFLLVFTFMSDNPDAPQLTLKNYLIRFFGVPAVVVAAILIVEGLIYGLGTLIQWLF